jgi:hypothetical protein
MGQMRHLIGSAKPPLSRLLPNLLSSWRGWLLDYIRLGLSSRKPSRLCDRGIGWLLWWWLPPVIWPCPLLLARLDLAPYYWLSLKILSLFSWKLLHWWLLKLSTIRLLTRTRHTASNSRRIIAIEIWWSHLINWRPIEDFLHNVTNRINQHLIVICKSFMNGWKSLVWFWTIDETLVLTSMLSTWIRWGWYLPSGGA